MNKILGLPASIFLVIKAFLAKQWHREVTLTGKWAELFKTDPGSLFQMKGLYLIVGIIGVVLGLATLPSWLIMGTFYSIAIILLLYGVTVFLGIFVVKKRK
jgi:hypothetical protein